MFVRVIELLGILAFCLLSYIIFQRLESQFPLPLPILALSIGFGYFFGDLLSGIIHWVCDRLGSSQTPLLGPLIIHPFRYHHRDPQKIVRESLVENLGASAIAGSLIFLPNLWWLPLATGGFMAFALQTGYWTVVFSVLSNLSHRWAHIPVNQQPIWIKLLQKSGLLISREHHMKHHRPPFRTHYCILSGWANIVTNRVPWPLFESFIAKTGIRVEK